jgi:hypothetical protein
MLVPYSRACRFRGHPPANSLGPIGRHTRPGIAILYALGVTATGFLLLLIGLTVFKRYKTIKHAAVFKGRVRVTKGVVPGAKETWTTCYGGPLRWELSPDFSLRRRRPCAGARARA